MKQRELLQIYASFDEKRLSAEWIWAATRQVEGKEVTQRSAVVADRWLLPSAESQISLFFFLLLLLLPAPLLFSLGERLLCAPRRKEDLISDAGRDTGGNRPARVLVVSKELVEGQTTLARSNQHFVSEVSILTAASCLREMNICKKDLAV